MSFRTRRLSRRVRNLLFISCLGGQQPNHQEGSRSHFANGVKDLLLQLCKPLATAMWRTRDPQEGVPHPLSLTKGAVFDFEFVFPHIGNHHQRART